MIIKEGKTKEELLIALEEIDSLTNLDSVVKTNEKLNLECVKENGHIYNWKLSKSKSIPHSKVFSYGKGLKRFVQAVNNFEKETTLFQRPDCTVLCHVSTSLSKTWDGKISSEWIEINPGQPYELSEEGVIFPTKKLVFTEAEYDAMSEVGLAFYCSSTGIYYPITKPAFASIGVYLDATIAFNRIDSHLLASAMLLAEKLSYAKSFSVINRFRSKRVRPIYAVVSSRYKRRTQMDFYERAFSEEACEIGVFEIDNWKVLDTFTEVWLRYSLPWKEHDFLLKIVTSDTAHHSYSLSLYIEIKGYKMCVLKNTFSHRNFDLEQQMNILFSGVHEAINDCNSLLKRIENAKVRFNNKMLNKIHSNLGKRRVEVGKKFEDGVYNAKELFLDILNERYMPLAEHYMHYLEVAFYELLLEFDKNLEEE